MKTQNSFLEFIGLVALIVIVVLGVNFYHAQKQQGDQLTITTENTVAPVIQDLVPATAVWSNEVIPHPAAPRSVNLNSGDSKLPGGAAEGTIHHEGIELLKDRTDSETRNR